MRRALQCSIFLSAFSSHLVLAGECVVDTSEMLEPLERGVEDKNAGWGLHCLSEIFDHREITEETMTTRAAVTDLRLEPELAERGKKALLPFLARGPKEACKAALALARWGFAEGLD